MNQTPLSLVLLPAAKTERLIASLLHRLLSPLSSPFAQDVILIDDSAHEKYLQKIIADNLGICAHIQFSFPAAFIWSLISKALDDIPSESPFDAPFIKWRLYDLFFEADMPEAIIRYLGTPVDEQKAYFLAESLSRLFSHYRIYRPDWLEKWQHSHSVFTDEHHTDEIWQATLWRLLLHHIQHGMHACQPHPEKRLFEFLNANPHKVKQVLPERITLFGLYNLPPQYLDFLSKLGKYTDIECLQFDPFWASSRQQSRFDSESTNFLANFWGRQSRQLIAGWYQKDGQTVYVADQSHDIDEPSPASFLEKVQQDILTDTLPEPVAKAIIDDGSIVCHIASSLMREMEILQDQLLHRFQTVSHDNCALKPEDILVLVPNLDEATPFIHAVFGAADADRFLPYTISASSQASPLKVFAQLFDLIHSRFEITSVIPFFYIDAIAEQFDLPKDHIQTIIDLLNTAGARWGIDQAHRKTQGFDRTYIEYSWQYAMDRLMLGYAMPSFGHHIPILIDNITPHSWLYGHEAHSLFEPVCQFLLTLFNLVKQKPDNATYADWVIFLRRLQQVFSKNDTLYDAIDNLIHTIDHQFSVLGKDRKLGAITISHTLQSAISHTATRYHNIVDGITFAEMGHFRQIPFSVICVTGVDYEHFPRTVAPIEFDLMKENKRPLDPEPKTADKAAMLDALLAARDCFYVSFTGFSNQTHDKLPESIILSEWLHYLKGYHDDAPKTIPHPLHPFSPAYNGQDFITYAKAYQQPSNVESLPVTWFDEAVNINQPTDMADLINIDWQDLLRFYRNPSAYFLHKQLDLCIPKAITAPSAEEPFDSERHWDKERQQFEAMLQNEKTATVKQYERYLAHGADMPPGELGALLSEQKIRQYQSFWATVQQHLQNSEALDPLDIELVIGGYRLTGKLDKLYSDQWLDCDIASNLDIHPQLECYFHAVLLACLPDVHLPKQATLVAKDGHCAFELPQAIAHSVLECMLTYYVQGQTMPLAFFPKSSFEYAECQHKNKPFMAQHWKKSYGNRNKGTAESENRWFYQTFGNLPSPDDLTNFATIAIHLLAPLFEHKR